MYKFIAQPDPFKAILVHIILFVCIFLVIRWSSIKLFRKERAINVQVFTFTLLVSWMILELTLRILGTYATYLEQKLGNYVSLKDIMPQEALLKRMPNDTVIFQSQGEFKTLFTANSDGYSDIEWVVPDADSTIRVLVLGDSFTEGYGADQDSGWVAQIRHYDFGKPVTWYNAGISGSDPFFGYYALENDLQKINPHIVLQLFSSQDFRDDIPTRGGMERFTGDGVVQYPPGRKSEIIYAYSHVSRFWFREVLGLNQFLIDEQVSTSANDQNLRQIATLDRAYHKWAVQHTARVYFLFFPCLWGEVMDSTYTADIMNYISAHGSPGENIPVIDLLPCYREYYNREEVAFQKRWWPLDGHHNSKGYQMMAACVAAFIKDILSAEAAATE